MELTKEAKWNGAGTNGSGAPASSAGSGGRLSQEVDQRGTQTKAGAWLIKKD